MSTGPCAAKPWVNMVSALFASFFNTTPTSVSEDRADIICSIEIQSGTPPIKGAFLVMVRWLESIEYTKNFLIITKSLQWPHGASVLIFTSSDWFVILSLNAKYFVMLHLIVNVENILLQFSYITFLCDVCMIESSINLLLLHCCD